MSENNESALIQNKPELKVVFDTIFVEPHKEYTKVFVQIIVYGFGKTASSSITLHIKQKASLKNFLEKILVALNEHLSSTLLCASIATTLESVSHVLELEKKATRKKILKVYEKDFNKRNNMPSSSNTKISNDELVEMFIEAWKRLEKEKGVPINSPTREAIASKFPCTVTNLMKLIKKHPNFSIDDLPSSLHYFEDLSKMKPTYQTFLNVCRAKKQMQETHG